VLIYAALKYKNITYFQINIFYFAIYYSVFLTMVSAKAFIKMIGLKNYVNEFFVVLTIILLGVMVYQIREYLFYKRKVIEFYKANMDLDEVGLKLYNRELEKSTIYPIKYFADNFTNKWRIMIMIGPKSVKKIGRSSLVYYYAGYNNLLLQSIYSSDVYEPTDDKIKNEKSEKTLRKRRKTLINSLEPRK
jgi:hypothetical protein